MPEKESTPRVLRGPLDPLRTPEGLPVQGGEGVHTGIDLACAARLLDAMEVGVELDALR